MSIFHPSRRALVQGITALIASALLAGCKQRPTGPGFLGNDISGSKVGGGLNMVDPQGQPRTLASFQGKITVFFFGFTQCPDVCPTALASLAETMALLGPDAAQVQVVMITVDPERDTGEILARYTTTFSPGFIGLTGSPEQLSATARSFKAYYAKVRTAQPGQYTMDHSSSFYVFDKNGQPRVLIRGDSPPQTIATDLRTLMQAG